jgi:neutral ceramidase
MPVLSKPSGNVLMRIVSVALLFLFIPTIQAAELTAGAAQIDITPPVGCPMAGYYSIRGAEGTHDPLFAKALVVEHNQTKLALVTLDLIGTTFDMVHESRNAIADATGIPGTHVMISATHSHTGPVLSDGRARNDAFGGSQQLAVDYMKQLPSKIATAVKAADAARQPAILKHAIGREEGLAFNRRFHMVDGSIAWNPGKKNPRVVRPAGPTDPSVPIVSIETPKGDVIAVYVNFAMHLDTVGGLYYSADYPYALSQAIAAAKGDKVVTLFATGCCGDINHINVNSPAPQKGHTEAARIGSRLAAEVLRTFEKLEVAKTDSVRVSHELVELPLPEVSEAEYESAKKIVDLVRSEAKPAPKFMDQVQAFKAVDVKARLGKPHAVEVQVMSIGDSLAWVSLPGEIFVQLGLSIKDGSPFRTTMITELANGSIGYVPTRVAYSEGNYEVVSARCASGSGETLVDSAVKQLREQFRK